MEFDEFDELVNELRESERELANLRISIKAKIASGADPRGVETAAERGRAESLINSIIPNLENEIDEVSRGN